jgi:diadenosine tetraphosphate (Ap4A) HIT family hydrolase
MVSEEAIAVPHPRPLTPWHIVIAPRRHVAVFYDLDVQEQHMVWNMMGEIRNRIASSVKVEGFHLGFEDGSTDNESTAHTLVHVVPRTAGTPLRLPAGIEWVDGSQ